MRDLLARISQAYHDEQITLRIKNNLKDKVIVEKDYNYVEKRLDKLPLPPRKQRNEEEKKGKRRKKGGINKSSKCYGEYKSIYTESDLYYPKNYLEFSNAKQQKPCKCTGLKD